MLIRPPPPGDPPSPGDPPPPGRSRRGYVMVHLEEGDRRDLERVRDELEAELGLSVGLAGAFRWLLRRHAREGRSE